MNIVNKIFGIYNPPIQAVLYHSKEPFVCHVNNGIPYGIDRTIRWRHSMPVNYISANEDDFNTKYELHRVYRNRRSSLKSNKITVNLKGHSITKISQMTIQKSLKYYSN